MEELVEKFILFYFFALTEEIAMVCSEVKASSMLWFITIHYSLIIVSVVEITP